MLTITIPSTEYYDETTNEFVNVKEETLELEHSLVSISKWESKWCKPFLNKTDKTFDESIDYIRCMTLTENVEPTVYNRLTNNNIQQVSDYIDLSMTATVINKDTKGSKNREIITSEIIYYWMIALTIPFECQLWHLNRLLTLINVCNIKNQPPKKMNKKEIMKNNTSLNELRRKALNTNG